MLEGIKEREVKAQNSQLTSKFAAFWPGPGKSEGCFLFSLKKAMQPYGEEQPVKWEL